MSAAHPLADHGAPDAIDPQAFRAVMGRFATGVTVVTYLADGEPAAMTANAFMSVSLSPPLVLVSVRRTSRFASQVMRGDRYGVSFLHEGQEHLSRHFGGQPIPSLKSPFVACGDMPVIEGALAQVVATVEDVHPAGDHLLYVGRVERLTQGPAAQPLLFSGGQYRQVQALPQAA